MMYARQYTPPSAEAYLLQDGTDYRSPYSYYNSSPDSAITSNTNITSPDKSPRSPIIQHGPTLLPKVRCQDQVTEPTSGPMLSHSRQVSSASSSYHASRFPYEKPHRLSLMRRETSPPSSTDLYSPASAISSTYSATDSAFGSALNSPVVFNPQPKRASLAHARSSSASVTRTQKGHSRSASSGSVDESMMRFAYPTYRNMPQYITSSSASSTVSAATATANYVTALPDSHSVGYVPQLQMPQLPRASHAAQYSPYPTAMAHPVHSTMPSFTADASFDGVTGTSATTCLMDYLTAANPTPGIVRRVVAANGMRGLHPWFDVRNLRSWDDFTPESVTAIDGILPLLRVAVNQLQLPIPSPPDRQPETESSLRDIYRDYHLAKVNAALVVAQGEKHMVMRTCSTSVPGRPQPDFISNMESDYEKTIFGDGRGRVVGLVRTWNAWNSSMRAGSPPMQVKYLAGLAQLQYHMREHGCRYGFIITEIELLCVRAGGPCSFPLSPLDAFTAKQPATPVFGYLETAPPIAVSAHGVSRSTGLPRMTVEFALWYLNMLAKDDPLPGARTWRMDVGLPAALTRQNCFERDPWMPKASEIERREAKRLRGWVWPTDGLSKKEVGRVRRGRK